MFYVPQKIKAFDGKKFKSMKSMVAFGSWTIPRQVNVDKFNWNWNQLKILKNKYVSKNVDLLIYHVYFST